MSRRAFETRQEEIGGKEDWHGCPRESFDREHDRLLGPN